VLLPNAKEDFEFKKALAPFAEDPEGDALTFTLVSPPSWASINAQGELVGTPLRPHLNLQTFRIRVSDQLSGGFDEAEVQVTVDRTNDPPEWTQNPIVLPDAPERSPSEQSPASFVTDPDPMDQMT